MTWPKIAGPNPYDEPHCQVPRVGSRRTSRPHNFFVRNRARSCRNPCRLVVHSLATSRTGPQARFRASACCGAADFAAITCETNRTDRIFAFSSFGTLKFGSSTLKSIFSTLKFVFSTFKFVSSTLKFVFDAFQHSEMDAGCVPAL